NAILAAPDRQALLGWIRAQPLALQDTIDGRGLLMVHAGVLPSWTAEQTAALADEVAQLMVGPDFGDFLDQMYSDTPLQWSDTLTGITRLRAIVNVLTRLRFCSADDRMEFATKEGADAAPAGFWPWFDAPGRMTRDVTVAFGHWSTLGWLGRSDVLSLDTGCVWGGHLSAVRVNPLGKGRGFSTELLQVPCAQAQRPGQ
ncbi:MAG: symmetrical bis(5'-nucleosyl)-tetraphosphatase, partial [Betaproteobacteria bacterium]